MYIHKINHSESSVPPSKEDLANISDEEEVTNFILNPATTQIFVKSGVNDIQIQMDNEEL